MRTPDEEAAYQNAFQFLYTVGPDGSWADSPSTIVYKQYRDAWFGAQETYKNKEIEAKYTADASVKERWTTVDEPILRSKIAELESEWSTKGHRAEYESAKRTYEQFVGSSPSVIWDEWTKLCMPGLDKFTDAVSAQEFFPCGFSPSNALDSSAWTTLTLTENEVEGLANAAPPEIRRFLAPDHIDLDIESLSLEICSVLITRSWFAPEVFKVRFWKFYDAGKVLSNGQIPVSGDCPAYAVAVVFARNLAIKLKPQSPKNQQAMTLLKASSTLSFATFKLAASPTTPSPGQTLMLMSARPDPAPVMMIKPAAAPMAVGPARMAPAARSTRFARAVVDDESAGVPPGTAGRSNKDLPRYRNHR